MLAISNYLTHTKRCMLVGINTYRYVIKLVKTTSVTVILKYLWKSNVL